MTFAVVPELRDLDKERLRDARGTSYREYVRSLVPRYGVVWLHIACGYAVLLAVGLGVAALDGRWLGVLADRALGVSLGALLFGYTLAFLHLFLHEAAHWNLAPSRTWNDRLANLLLGSFLGVDIRSYRPIHWEHHRHLGTTRDTERSYFESLSLRFVVEALTGIRVLRVLAGRRRALASAPAKGEERAARSRHQPFTAAVLNLALLALLVLSGNYAVALAWALGLGVVFPFFASVRQVLEHRDERARADVDYASVDHGAVNRMFGSGPLASTLGGAGFNRHLLHHLEPQLSYTRLAELERFLLGTELRDALLTHRATYVGTFVRLLRAGAAR
ncbi:MAG: fatty acid desaturase [Planctomycetes bacterium]|nr:fatty acid desaturase [Planctomycetota bacterium]